MSQRHLLCAIHTSFSSKIIYFHELSYNYVLKRSRMATKIKKNYFLWFQIDMLGYCFSLESYCFVFGWSTLYCFRVIKDNTIFQLGAVLLRVPFRDLWAIRLAPASLIVSQVTFHPSTPRPKVRSNHFCMKYTTNLTIYKIHLSGRHS